MKKVFLFLFFSCYLINAYSFDCYPKKYYWHSKTIKNIPLKKKCHYLDRLSEIRFNLGYFFFAGRFPIQIPQLFRNINNPVLFDKDILKKINANNGKYQPMMIHLKDKKYGFFLVLEIDDKIYNYRIKNNDFYPYFHSYPATKHYFTFVDNNKLVFISDGESVSANLSTYFFIIKLPLSTNDSITVISKKDNEFRHLVDRFLKSNGVKYELFEDSDLWCIWHFLKSNRKTCIRAKKYFE